jgi:hypothetical protein
MDIVVSYDRIIDQEGALTHVDDPAEEFPRVRTHPYASSMLDPNLSPGQRAGLVAAGILHAGKNIAYPYPSETFSYHLRGMLHLNDNSRQQFPAIVKAIQRLMNK